MTQTSDKAFESYVEQMLPAQGWQQGRGSHLRMPLLQYSPK